MRLFYGADFGPQQDDLGLFVNADDAGQAGKLLVDYWSAGLGCRF